MSERCCETVFERGWSHPCSRKATKEHEGKRYCAQHYPLSVAERRKERDAKWANKWEQERIRCEENERHRQRAEACVAALDGIPNPAEFVRAARELAAWFEHCGFNAQAHSSNCKCGGTCDGGKTWCGQQHEIVARLLAAGGGQ